MFTEGNLTSFHANCQTIKTNLIIMRANSKQTNIEPKEISIKTANVKAMLQETILWFIKKAFFLLLSPFSKIQLIWVTYICA